MVFMDTAATIPTGAMAERWKFSAFVIYGFFMSHDHLPGLRQLGLGRRLARRSSASTSAWATAHVDFAGSSVVHMIGGVTALAGGLVLGPRIGKYNKDGTPNAIPGHNIPMVIARHLHPGLRLVRLQPRLAPWPAPTCASASSPPTPCSPAPPARCRRHALHVARVRQARPVHDLQRHAGRPGGHHRPLRLRQPGRRLLIGLIAGVLVVGAASSSRASSRSTTRSAPSRPRRQRRLGLLALGLFADGTYGDGWNGVTGTVTGLFYGGGGQFVAEAIGVLTNIVFVGSGVHLLQDPRADVGNRVSAKTEIEGLDIPEMGIPAYDDHS